jgi:serine/threonine protein kinase
MLNMMLNSQQGRPINLRLPIQSKHITEGKLIGKGGFGSVYEYHHEGDRYAVKSIRKSTKEIGISDIINEIAMLRQMRHRGIINLIRVSEDKEFVHLFTELCQGGELFQRIIDRVSNNNTVDRTPCFNEHEAARIIHQVLDAVLYMHANDVVHRDIKPENILFVSNDRDSQIKIIDLGLARHHFDYDPPMTDYVGTSYYVAPEVIGGSYRKSCDLWSVGVVAYFILSGCPPFDGADDAEIFESILTSRYCVGIGRNGEKLSTVLSAMSMDFVVKLLEAEPGIRMCATSALKHPWMKYKGGLKHDFPF